MPNMHINRVVLTGNLTHDPQLRALTSGTNVCHLRVACNGRRRVGEGNYEDVPNFFDVSVFGVQGEAVARHLKRGRPVAVDGRLAWREWETPDHQRRQSVSIVADSVQFLGAPPPKQDAPAESEPEPELDAGGLTDDEAALAAVGAAAAIDDDLSF